MANATWKQNIGVMLSGASLVGVLLLSAHVASIVRVEPSPIPVPVVVQTDIIGPTTVPVGKLAKFSVKDIEQPEWEVVAKSTTLADPQFDRDSNGLSIHVETDVEGTYRVAVRGLRDGRVVGFATTLVVGVAPQPPPVVVVPPAPPTPTPTPVVEGKRHVFVIYETSDTSPELGAMLTDLRAGEPAKYLKSKGHVLDIFDDELVDDAWLRVLGDVKLPAMVVADLEGDKFIDAKPLPASGADVIAFVKGNGG